MILAVFVLVTVAVLAAIALGRSHRQMNTACIVQAVLFLALAAWLVLSDQVPGTALAVGNGFFVIDHLGI